MWVVTFVLGIVFCSDGPIDRLFLLVCSSLAAKCLNIYRFRAKAREPLLLSVNLGFIQRKIPKQLWFGAGSPCIAVCLITVRHPILPVRRFSHPGAPLVKGKPSGS